ncbi:hypothetical protein P154DRAFT_571915 [Amniculicola lignicola CBS 123094]|uniref:Rhodopsin domain-containing protein n=1 Tax=Amniculicola lignicola CBS 123094 TaxID=1392246 RepID=A0A6A5WUD7_9PLEO|nr:hypothetical protein P154DRAFT_571915 [Amniculicola lignicola CBS 123094]
MEPIIVLSGVCLVISLVAVVARSFTKSWVMRKFEVEDYALIFACLGFGAFVGILIAACNAGQGQHVWNISKEDAHKVAHLTNFLDIIYPPVMFAAKLAILLQIKRIFAAHHKNFNYWAVQTLIAINFLVYMTLALSFIFACWPRKKIWNPSVPGTCVDRRILLPTTSTINILSDASILLLPTLSIAKLDLPIRQRLAAGAIFATGAFACAASIVRLVYSVRFTHTNDATWAIEPVERWALAECTTVILVGCFPVFPRLVKFIMGTDAEIRHSKLPSGSTFS